MKKADKGVVEKVAEVVGEGFSVERFVESFDVLADAAGGTKRLKELVLSLGVRGRLGTYEPDENSADRLLGTLRSARAHLAVSGVRVDPDLPEVGPEECPHAVPSGWRWVRLGHLGGFLGGGTPAKSNHSFWEGPIPWVSPKDMKQPYIGDSEDHISPAAIQGSAVKLISTGSLLFVVRGMILAHSFPCALTTREVTVNQDMKALVLALPELGEFLLRVCQAARSRVLARVERSSHGTCRLDSEVVEMLPVALPAVAEQKRIIAKIGILLTLCDELEARQSKKREIGARLTRAALDSFVTADSKEDLTTAWTRVERHLPSLFDHSGKIPAFRATVLEFASLGLLVPQARSESATDDLLKRVLTTRNAIRPGSTTEEDLIPSPPPVPHPIPATWRMAALEALTHPVRIIRYGMLMPGEDHPGGPRYVKVRNMKNGVIDVAGLPRTTPEIYAKYAGAALAKGDLLMSIRGSFGGVAVVPDEIEGANITQDSARIAPLSVDRDYLLHVLRSPMCQRYFAAIAKGAAVQGINIGDIRRTPIPLPPLEEQRRIVAKVEHLLSLCDALEASLRRAEDRASRYAEAVVRELVA